jgi:non-heme chloroperoxidase
MAGQPVFWGNDMDSYADFLADVLEAFDLKDATLMGYSPGGGGGKVVRYIGRHGNKRVARLCILGSAAVIHHF